MKSTWWVNLGAAHKKGQGQPTQVLRNALQSLPLNSIPAASVWMAVLTSDDDQMSIVYGQLEPEARTALRCFSEAVEQGVKTLNQELREWAECVQEATEIDIA